MKVICLAGGKGSRLNSSETNIPKALREVKGKALISYVLKNTNFVEPSDTTIVVGYQSEKVIEHCGDKYNYAIQTDQLGTGHAVMCAKECFENEDTDVLICFCDMPLISNQSYKNIVDHHRSTGADCTILTATVKSPPSYGRIVRVNGLVTGIVEQKDCTPEQLLINEINIGIHVYKANVLCEYLSQLKCNNAQKEYYLTDLPHLMLKDNKKIETSALVNDYEYLGVTTKEDLDICEKYL